MEMRELLVDEEKHDMLDTVVQDKHLKDCEDVMYDAAMISCPCSSFTPARDNRDGQESDPRLLRGPLPPEIYGLKDLNHKEGKWYLFGSCYTIRTRRYDTRYHRGKYCKAHDEVWQTRGFGNS